MKFVQPVQFQYLPPKKRVATYPKTMSVPNAFRLLTNPLRSSRRLYTTGTNPVRFASVDEKLSPTVAKVVGAKGALSPAALHADGPLRNNWSRDEIQAIYDSPLMELLYFGVSAS